LEVEVVNHENVVQNLDSVVFIVFEGQLEALTERELNFNHNVNQIRIRLVFECKNQDSFVHFALQHQLADVHIEFVVTLGVVQLVTDDAADHADGCYDFVFLPVVVDDFEQAYDAVYSHQLVHPLFVAGLRLFVQYYSASLDDDHCA